MNQNQNQTNQTDQTPALPEDKKLSKIGFSLNLLKFTKLLYIFGMILIPVMISSSLTFLLNDINYVLTKPEIIVDPSGKFQNYYFVPGSLLLLFSGLFIVMIVFLKKKCETQDFIGIEKIAVIASYFLRSSEIMVSGTIIGINLSSGSLTLKFVLESCILPMLTFLIVTSMAALNLHAVRTKNNNLLESYIIARYIITGAFFLYIIPMIIFGYQMSYMFLTSLTWLGLMIISIGMTLILHGIRSENNENSKNKGQNDSIPMK